MATRIPPPKPPFPWREAKKLYLERRLSYVAVARLLGYSPKTVCSALRAHRVRRHPPRKALHSKWSARLYGVFQRIRQCCECETYRLYPLYGARDVRVSPRWRTFEAFYAWARESGYRPGLSLALIHGNRNFSPSNCRWQTASERVLGYLRHKPSRTGRAISAFGETKSVLAWSKDPRCVVARNALSNRLADGYPPEKAITMPAHRRDRSARTGVRRLPKAPKQVDWGRAERLYATRGLSCPEIARELQVSYETILDGLTTRGIYRRPPKSRHQTPVGQRLGRIWRMMHKKCADPADAQFRYYGARRIRVCREWATLDAFHDWALDAGYRTDLVLTRRDMTRGFSPENCIWTLLGAVARRPKEHVKKPPARWTVTAFGETKGPTAWSLDPRCAVRISELLRRLRGGESPARAISRPPKFPRDGSPSAFITAFRQTKGLIEWARDRRCKVSVTGLRLRILAGIPPEEAITTRPYQLDPLDWKHDWRLRARG